VPRQFTTFARSRPQEQLTEPECIARTAPKNDGFQDRVAACSSIGREVARFSPAILTPICILIVGEYVCASRSQQRALRPNASARIPPPQARRTRPAQRSRGEISPRRNKFWCHQFRRRVEAGLPASFCQKSVTETFILQGLLRPQRRPLRPRTVPRHLSSRLPRERRRCRRKPHAGSRDGSRSGDQLCLRARMRG
jgi:hypothetical protein